MLLIFLTQLWADMAKTKKNNTNQQSNQEPLLYSIKRIKELAFFINEYLFKPEENDTIVNYNQKLGYTETGFVDFTLRAFFVYKNHPKDALFSIDVQTIFEVKDLKKYITKDKRLNLPSQFLITMVSLSVSHTRALLAKQTSDTLFAQNILPVVNAIEMAKAFFPENIT